MADGIERYFTLDLRIAMEIPLFKIKYPIKSWCVVLCLVNIGLVAAQVEGDVRLVDGYHPDSNQGRVEVFHDGAWGTMCGRGWGSEEATVVCRQLGLDEVLLANAFFGNGSGAIYVGADCNDHDFHINECHGRWEEKPTTCTHDEDIAVICYPENHEDAYTGLSLWNEMIIVVAIGVFCLLVLKVVTFLEDSKAAVDGDGEVLHDVKTDDHPHAASQQVSISDECAISANQKKATSGNDVAASKDEVIANERDVTTDEDNVKKNLADINSNEIGENSTTENDETDQKQISVDKPRVIQTANVSVQTLK